MYENGEYNTFWRLFQPKELENICSMQGFQLPTVRLLFYKVMLFIFSSI